MPITTLAQARALLSRRKVMTMTRARSDVPALVEEIAGPVKGSWWGHPKGKLIYQIASALEDDPTVLAAKLVARKITFLDQALFAPLLRVVTDEDWRRSRTRGLSAAARRLGDEVEAAGTVRPDSTPARRELEERALALVSSEHTDSGRHAAVLRSWAAWAPAADARRAGRLGLDEALALLREVGVDLAG